MIEEEPRFGGHGHGPRGGDAPDAGTTDDGTTVDGTTDDAATADGAVFSPTTV